MTESYEEENKKLKQKPRLGEIIEILPLICKYALYGFGGLVIFVIGIKIFIKLLEIF